MKVLDVLRDMDGTEKVTVRQKDVVIVCTDQDVEDAGNDSGANSEGMEHDAFVCEHGSQASQGRHQVQVQTPSDEALEETVEDDLQEDAPEEYDIPATTSTSWYERDIVPMLSNQEEPNWNVKGAWAYVAGAKESDFGKKENKNRKQREKPQARSPATARPEAEEPETARPEIEDSHTQKVTALEKIGVIRSERTIEGNGLWAWTYVAGARGSDFQRNFQSWPRRRTDAEDDDDAEKPELDLDQDQDIEVPQAQTDVEDTEEDLDLDLETETEKPLPCLKHATASNLKSEKSKEGSGHQQQIETETDGQDKERGTEVDDMELQEEERNVEAQVECEVEGELSSIGPGQDQELREADDQGELGEADQEEPEDVNQEAKPLQQWDWLQGDFPDDGYYRYSDEEHQDRDRTLREREVLFLLEQAQFLEEDQFLEDEDWD